MFEFIELYFELFFDSIFSAILFPKPLFRGEKGADFSDQTNPPPFNKKSWC